METREQLIHQLCIMGIKRGTMKPYDAYTWSRFYEDGGANIPGIEITLSESELLICSTVIDSNNYSILTTHRLLTRENGHVSEGYFGSITFNHYGDFKGMRDKQPWTFGVVIMPNGDELKYFVETGKASMIIVQGIKARFQAEDMNAQQLQTIARAWTRRVVRDENEA